MNTSRYLPQRFWLGADALWLMAALRRWWAAAAFELLSTDYVAETSWAAKLWSCQKLWFPLTFATAGLISIAVGFCTLRRGAR